MISDVCRSRLDTWWAAALGCLAKDLSDGRTHSVAAPEPIDRSNSPFHWTAFPIALVTTGKGWVLSVPERLVGEAEKTCTERSFAELVGDGDARLCEWYERRETVEGLQRPGPLAYPILGKLTASLRVRGWSHYCHWFADPHTWPNEPVNPHVRRLTSEEPDVWTQWLAWPGNFCKPGFNQHFEVHDAFGYILDGRLVSVAQIQASEKMQAWEFGIDTLKEHRHRGYATATGRAATAEIVRRGKIPWYYYDHYNTGSGRIPEKLGYRLYLEGMFSHPA